jgi:hypothetical protein
MPMLKVAAIGHPSTSSAASANADELGARRRPFLTNVIEHDREFLAAQTADEIGQLDVLLRGPREDLQDAIADRMSEPVIGRFEVIEIDQQNRGRARTGGVTPGQFGTVLQKGPAVGDPGERIRRCAGETRRAPWPSPAG